MAKCFLPLTTCRLQAIDGVHSMLPDSLVTPFGSLQIVKYRQVTFALSYIVFRFSNSLLQGTTMFGQELQQFFAFGFCFSYLNTERFEL